MNMEFDVSSTFTLNGIIDFSHYRFLFAGAEWKILINIFMKAKAKITGSLGRLLVRLCHSKAKSLKFCFCYHLSAIRCSEK